MKKKYLIIGNGTAAVGCIEGIRSMDKTGEILVVSEENHHVYGRPLISYYLEGRTTLDKMLYRPKDFYENNNVKVLYDKKVVSLDAKGHKATLDDKTVVEYSKVCVCTGSSPFVPPFEGLEKVKEKYSFMKLDDCLALEKVLTPDTKVLIAGAGLIGLKCAEGICDRVKSISVFDLAPRVLSSILDDECAALMQSRLEEHGVKFYLGDSAEKFEENKVYMKSGAVIDFDVCVLAVGVRANTALVKDNGGEVNRGIIVDTSMHTSLKDVFAAGDCTEGYDATFGANRVIAILPNAYFQGHCAGVVMADGEETCENAFPMNSIGFFGLHAMTAGTYYTAEQGGEMYEEKEPGTIKRLYTRGGVLTGFILIGRNERAGIYTSLIREKTPLSSIDFDTLKKSPDLSALTKEYRKAKLGGIK